MHKLLPVLLSTLAVASTAHAQDKLRLRNGSIIEAKVTEIGSRELTYKRFNNPTGPTYRVNKSDVASVEYENGSTEDFGRGNDASTRPTFDYGQSVISLAPIQFTDVSVRGVGLYYEHALDTRGILALQLPVVLSFPSSFNNSGYDGVFTSIQPGLKIYPRGFAGAVRYALGPSLVFGFGRRNNTGGYYNQFGQFVYENIDQDVFHYGVMVNNSLNINPSEHLYLGLEFGLGLKYSNTNNNYYYYYESPVLTNFNFRIGYRF